MHSTACTGPTDWPAIPLLEALVLPTVPPRICPRIDDLMFAPMYLLTEMPEGTTDPLRRWSLITRAPRS